jgi:hypothetical protein
MSDVVLNPETGKPAVAETVYRDLELEAEEAKLSQVTSELEAVTSQHEELSDRKAALEGSVADQKSLIEGIVALTEPTEVGDDGEVDEGTVGDGLEEEVVEEASDPLL